MNAIKRKSVEHLATRSIFWGLVVLLKITYTDDRVSFGVSVPGMLTLFGGRESEAKDYYETFTWSNS